MVQVLAQVVSQTTTRMLHPSAQSRTRNLTQQSQVRRFQVHRILGVRHSLEVLQSSEGNDLHRRPPPQHLGWHPSPRVAASRLWTARSRARIRLVHTMPLQGAARGGKLAVDALIAQQWAAVSWQSQNRLFLPRCEEGVLVQLYTAVLDYRPVLQPYIRTYWIDLGGST